MGINFPNDETFLTTEEVLEYLQVNLRTVYRLIKAGKIPAVRVGRQWRFRKRVPKKLKSRADIATVAIFICECRKPATVRGFFATNCAGANVLWGLAPALTSVWRKRGNVPGWRGSY